MCKLLPGEMEGHMAEDLIIPSSRQIRALRYWLGISQGEFAQAAGIGVTTLVAFEKGHKVSVDTLEMIARQVARMEVPMRKDGAMVLAL
jgi:DNA-binding XRE family transcriptional regulator